MPRIRKPEEHNLKRGEILDAAQRMIYTKGFQQMSIEDILRELNISKGAFYHYFDSKHALLEAMIERMLVEIEQFAVPIVDDPDLPALEKLERFFSGIARWKTARKSFLKTLLKVWYHDNNALVRQKLALTGANWMATFLARIIRQGVAEGVMDSGLNDDAARVVITLMMSLGEGIAMAMLALEPDAGEADRLEAYRRMEHMVLAYRGAIERVLGAPVGSITLFDLDILSAWVMEPDVSPEPTGARP